MRLLPVRWSVIDLLLFVCFASSGLAPRSERWVGRSLGQRLTRGRGESCKHAVRPIRVPDVENKDTARPPQPPAAYPRWGRATGP